MKQIDRHMAMEQELVELRKQLEIEKALERLRASAMHESSGLKSILSLALKELNDLGVVTDLCAIREIELDAKNAKLWFATSSKDYNFSKNMLEKDVVEESISQILSSIKDERIIVSLEVEKRKNTAPDFSTQPRKDSVKNEVLVFESKQASKFKGICFVSDNTRFYIGNFSGGEYSEYEIQTIMRFAQVSEQIFTRYISLSKIEKKSRETKIEAMLERIRVRSIEMTNTSELQDVVNLVSNQLHEIQIAINGGVFISINEDVDNSRNVPIWGSGGATQYVQKAEVPYLDKPIFQNLSKSIRKRVGFMTEVYTRREKLEFFKHLFEHDPWVNAPDEFKAQLLSTPGGYARSAAILAHTTIFIINKEGEVFSEEENEILKRFSIVFEQSYVRFLDLRKTEEQARELILLNQAKDRLYTNITHEFRTPLTVILGIADQIEEDPERWLHGGISLIQRNSNRLMNLVCQMLDLSKLESGEVKVVYKNTDINFLVSAVIENMRSLAKQKGLAISFDTSSKVLSLDIDPDKIQMILDNLLSNAIKYSKPAGKIEVETKTVERSGSMLSLVVRDNGPGISDQDLPFVFDRFYQADDSHTRVDESTGIGLAIVKELITLMEGVVNVYSTIGVGSEFTVLLPIRHFAPKVESKDLTIPLTIDPFTTSKQRVEQFEAADEQILNSDKPLVLIIEDNEDVATYIEACISDTYTTKTAINGQLGIEEAIVTIPDLIILDVMMPVVDGFQACQMLKTDERTSHIPIVMVTAKADIESKREGLKFGADAYLYKPFDKQELRIRLEQLIELRRKLQLHYANPQESVEQLLPSQDHFLSRLNGSIDENLADSSFGVQELCLLMCMSRTQLLRKLKALTNSSISAYLKLARLDKAKQLLRQGEYAVSEVAYMVGYNDPLYFSRAFSTTYGLPPSGYCK